MTPVVVSLGRSPVRHAAVESSPGVLVPVTGCGLRIGSDRYVHAGMPVVSCKNCRKSLGGEYVRTP